MYRILLVAGLLLATTSSSAGPVQFDRTRYIDANDILMTTTNYGLLGCDVGSLFGYSYGTFYPYSGVANILNGTQTRSPLYSSGLWLGGIVSGTTRVAVSDFGSEFWPGPIVGGTYVARADTVSAYRVYKLYADSAAGNPNQDYLDWPAGLGAPVDELGHPLIRGSQTLWSVFNDANSTQHSLINGSTAPLGIEIRQSLWASDYAGYDRVVYVEFRLFNRCGDTIHDFYITPFFDPDLGGDEDDLTGCDTLTGTMFCYNSTNADSQYGSIPPALGIRLLYGPGASSPGDSAFFFGSWIHGYRNMRMSACASYVNGDDPQSATESYNLMKGFHRNGTPNANGTRFSYPGNPVTATGDLDPNPSNCHFVGSFGPLEFLPGDSQSFVLKLAIGQGSDRLSSLTDLRNVLDLPDSIATDVEDEVDPELPPSCLLSQNHPNPFNPSTTIDYSLPRKARVELKILDILGRTVRTLVTSRQQSAGNFSVIWDGRSDDGTQCSSGIYFYRLDSDLGSEGRKMVLLK